MGLFLDKLLYYDPEHVFCNMSGIMITTAYHQGNLNTQGYEFSREIHKTQIIMGHLKITSPKSALVDNALSSSFTLTSRYASHSTGTSAVSQPFTKKFSAVTLRDCWHINADVPFITSLSTEPVTYEVSVPRDIDSPCCDSHGRDKRDVLLIITVKTN
jgi:hypothetical protein